jgi:hypothetical protein
MAYSTTNPPQLLAQGIAGPRTWSYVSTDPTATVDGSGYFTDGYQLGMRAGDILTLHDTTTKIISTHAVLTAVSTTVDLGAGVTIGSTTNGD